MKSIRKGRRCSEQHAAGIAVPLCAAAPRGWQSQCLSPTLQELRLDGIWTDTIYDYTHFHSNAHEVLGIAEGKVTLRVGGE